jgi:hypothetical protein
MHFFIEKHLALHYLTHTESNPISKPKNVQPKDPPHVGMLDPYLGNINRVFDLKIKNKSKLTTITYRRI